MEQWVLKFALPMGKKRGGEPLIHSLLKSDLLTHILASVIDKLTFIFYTKFNQ